VGLGIREVRLSDRAPIVFFGYARPDHTSRALESLARNELASESVLYAFCDAPKREEVRESSEAVRQIVRNQSGFADKVLHFADTNRGLKRSIIEGVTSVLEKHGKAIVVEDDLLSASNFLTFLNEGLERYRSEPQVFSVCGYAPPMKNLPADYPFDAFFGYRSMSWGWSTWQDRWTKADWEMSGFKRVRTDPNARRKLALGGRDVIPLCEAHAAGKLDSWAVPWNFTLYENSGLSLLPVYSLIHSIGADGSGTHFTGTTDRYAVDLSLAKAITRWPDRVEVDPKMARAFRACYGRTLDRAIKKAVRILSSPFRRS